MKNIVFITTYLLCWYYPILIIPALIIFIVWYLFSVEKFTLIDLSSGITIGNIKYDIISTISMFEYFKQDHLTTISIFFIEIYNSSWFQKKEDMDGWLFFIPLFFSKESLKEPLIYGIIGICIIFFVYWLYRSYKLNKEIKELDDFMMKNRDKIKFLDVLDDVKKKNKNRNI